MSFPWFKGLRLTAGCRPSNLGTMLAMLGLCWPMLGFCNIAKGPKHRKKGCFWTPQAQNTVNYVGFSRPGVGRGWFGGGSAAGAAAPITFGKDTGCVASARIPWFPYHFLIISHVPRFNGSHVVEVLAQAHGIARGHDGTARPQHAHGESEGCQETQQTLANFGGFLGLFLGNKVIKTMIFGEILKSCLFVTCWEPNIFVEFWWFLIGGQDGETSWNMFFQRRLPQKEMGDGSEWSISVAQSRRTQINSLDPQSEQCHGSKLELYTIFGTIFW